MERILRKVGGLAKEAASGLGVEVEDVELLGRGRKSLLRVTIDKPGGVTVDDCEAVSRALEALLDVEDPIAGPFTLEVSSPGLDRPLRRLEDFARYRGRLAKVVTRGKVEGANVFVGRIEGVAGDKITVVVDGRKIELSYEEISRARLELEI